MSYIKRRLRDNRIILIRGVYTNMPYKIALKKFAYIICFFMFLLFPTSINSIPHSVKSIIVLWILESAVIVFFICEEKIDKKQLLKTMVIIGYLTIATIVATRENALYISLARIAPILCFVVMCCTNVKSRIQPSFFLGLLDTMCIILIVWNFLTLMKEPHFIKFVNLFYTQLDSYTATYWSLTKIGLCLRLVFIILLQYSICIFSCFVILRIHVINVIGIGFTWFVYGYLRCY